MSTEWCPCVKQAHAAVLASLAEGERSRHDSTRDAVRKLVAFGGEGHRGVKAAIEGVSRAFIAAVEGNPERAGAEWHRLLVGAIKLAAAKNPRPRQSCADDAATAVPAEMIPAGFTVPPPAPEGSPLAAGAPNGGGLTLPDEFWAARESLAKIRQAAHSKVRSGDVVFYGALVRIAAMAPHTLRADTGIGTPASLNLFAAIVGPSGGGKSSGLSVGRDLVKEAQPIEEFPLGSGEGIAEAYMGEVMAGTGVMDQKTGAEKMAKVRKMVRHNVLFHSDEGNSLNKLIERTGSTVGETLRSAWSGETIGQKNGRVETTRTVPARSYSAGLVIGYQPTTVLPLLDDVEAGTPQRFLFAWAVDTAIPARSARVPWPGEMPSPFPPDVPTDAPAPGTVISAVLPRGMTDPITFDEAITEELYDTEHAKNTGSLPAGHLLLDPFRSQHPVLKVKVAALLALLESRRRVTLDDWRLAQMVIDTSDRVRIYLQALALGKAQAAREAAERSEHALEWHREHARHSVREAVETSAERRVAVRAAVRVHESGGMTLGALRRATAMRDRPAVEAAVEIAVAAGWIAYGADEAGGTGRLTPGVSRPTV
jgi:hypothetical protein